ncbi:MAG: DUF1611 domain-containing protein [Candidatus Obscuribacterales bacterium]|nr:DUF1611 domain-containing protein [Candidatus Obscuribacterales bacterium]
MLSVESRHALTYYSQSARLVIYAEGEMTKGKAKTAEGVLRYAKNPVVAVIDSKEAGKKVSDITWISNSQVPIVGSVKESLAYKPDALLIGVAWSGGKLPPAWRTDIMEAIKSGMDIINGLHDFLSDDEEIAKLAAENGRRLIDVRRPPENLPVGTGKAINTKAMTVLTVGSDCSTGKMTVSLELDALAKARGHKSQFVATGQTGIMIHGRGIPLDRVIGDFMAGAIEELVVEAGKDNEFVFIEGQGSIVNASFSGVTLSLLHGSCPKAMILCHKPTREVDTAGFKLWTLSKLIPLYEQIAACMRPSKVVGIALNTYGMDDKAAAKAIADAEAETGLPATDPVRFGSDKLFDAILKHQEKIS